MDVYDLSPAAVGRMQRVDLTGLTAPPESPIGEFAFNDSTCGIGCFVGTPPWECHTTGDELLHVLAGETTLTILDDDASLTERLDAGAVVVVPRGRWHRNEAPQGVTILHLTPSSGNRHSSDDVPPD